jgi:hypothetical protein
MPRFIRWLDIIHLSLKKCRSLTVRETAALIPIAVVGVSCSSGGHVRVNCHRWLQFERSSLTQTSHSTTEQTPCQVSLASLMAPVRRQFSRRAQSRLPPIATITEAVLGKAVASMACDKLYRAVPRSQSRVPTARGRPAPPGRREPPIRYRRLQVHRAATNRSVVPCSTWKRRSKDLPKTVAVRFDQRSCWQPDFNTAHQGSKR